MDTEALKRGQRAARGDFEGRALELGHGTVYRRCPVEVPRENVDQPPDRVGPMYNLAVGEGLSSVPANVYTSGEYLVHNPTWHEEDSSRKASFIISILQANHLAPNSVCDVGCGVGEIIRCMASTFRDCNFVGYDISPQAVSRAQQKATANVCYKEGDAFASDTYYDLALAIDVFEHVDDYIGFVRKLKRMASFKLYHIPLDLSVQTVLRRQKLTMWRKELGHLHYFDKETALDTLEYAGYEIVDYRYTFPKIAPAGKTVLKFLADIPRRVIFRLAPDTIARLLGGVSLLVLCK